MKDWRLQGQEKYLTGKKLIEREYEPWSLEWDHDHCAFCRVKFSLDPDDCHIGYAVDGGYYWICRECCRDFATQFGWKIQSSDAVK